MTWIVGVDVGGTFTDSVLVDEEGEITFGKALSTPSNFSEGVLSAISDIAQTRKLGIEDLLSKNALKASQYNISQGELARYVVLRNVYPGGSSAECDYISSFFYGGPPPGRRLAIARDRPAPCRGSIGLTGTTDELPAQGTSSCSPPPFKAGGDC